MRISYLNGEFISHEKAFVHIDDRGLQFADAVYEVVSFYNERLLDFEPHIVRLSRSLKKLSIGYSVDAEALRSIMLRLISDNSLSEGIIYLQITRGVAPRDHAFPKESITPTVIATASPLDITAISMRQNKGVKIVLTDENRWSHVDIKSTSLLGNVLAKEMAYKANAYEAVYVDRNNFITEGTSTNIWIVNSNNTLVTHKTDGAILSGITRNSVIKIVSEVEQRSFSKTELLNAKEVFLTSTTSLVTPVIQIDSQCVGNGRPGQAFQKLKKIFTDYIKEQTGFRFPKV